MSRWLWNVTLGLIALALAAGLALIVALALGWNSPRPDRPPDWQPPGLPLRLVAPSNDATVALLGYPSDDFTLEVEALPVAGPAFNGYGLVYRAQDAARYTAFAVGSDGYYGVLRVVGDEETPLVDWQQFPHIRRDRQPNQLRITCAGPTCRFYVNDEYATTVEDDAWLAGDVGLWVRAFGEEDVAVQFQAARVWVGTGHRTGRRDGGCEPGADALVCLRVPAARAAAELRREGFLPLAGRRDILDQAQDDDVSGGAVGTDAGQFQSHRR